MQTITTTQLRTKSKQLIESLKRGESVDLIHRSKIVGKIKPNIADPKPFNPDNFRKAIKKLNLPKITWRESRKRYQKHLLEKYGKNLS